MKRENLPVVSNDELKKIESQWFKTVRGIEQFKQMSAKRKLWNAFDVLELTDMKAKDKLHTLLRPDFLPTLMIHEFGCQCAELAIGLVYVPDERSLNAIRMKRLWMEGLATDFELATARIKSYEPYRAAVFDSTSREKHGSSWPRAAHSAFCAASTEYEVAGMETAEEVANAVACDEKNKMWDWTTFEKELDSGYTRMVSKLGILIDEWDVQWEREANIRRAEIAKWASCQK